MRRAVSVQSLSGESRTFAELPDLEVERVVLHYLRIQGLREVCGSCDPNSIVALKAAFRLGFGGVNYLSSLFNFKFSHCISFKLIAEARTKQNANASRIEAGTR